MSGGSTFCFDTLRVLRFGKQYAPVLASEDMKGLGLMRDGELVAGVIYEGYTGRSMWMHVAGAPGRRWLTRDYLRYCFEYPFIELGVERLYGWVNEANKDARRFDEHLGFRQVSRIDGAGPNGGDVLIYRMDKADCRFLRGKHG